MNWVLGHIIVGRNEALELLGTAAIWGKSEIERYVSGSEPITHDEQALPFERLLADLDESQRRIVDALASSPQVLDKTVQTERGERAVGELVAGLHWHETYHTGQLELLRQLAGKDDAIA